MGNERPAEAGPAASASIPTTVTATGARSGRDPDAVRATTAPPAEIGEHDDREEAAADLGDEVSLGSEASDDERLGARPEADANAEAGDVCYSSSATEAEGQMTLEEIELHVLRAIRYHEARARFLDFWRRVFDFLVILGGAGAVSTAANSSPFWGTVLGVAVAAIGALQLVAGFSEKAGEHTSLKRRFCGVLARITEARSEASISERELAKITKRWAAIWSDEPPTMHVLEAIAYNAASRTRIENIDDQDLIEIGLWQSLTRNLSSWESFEPLTRRERAARQKG